MYHAYQCSRPGFWPSAFPVDRLGVVERHHATSRRIGSNLIASNLLGASPLAGMDYRGQLGGGGGGGEGL